MPFVLDARGPQFATMLLTFGAMYSSSSSAAGVVWGACDAPKDDGGDGALVSVGDTTGEDEGWRVSASLNACATSMTVARLPVLGIRACRAGLAGGLSVFCAVLWGGVTEGLRAKGGGTSGLVGLGLEAVPGAGGA